MSNLNVIPAECELLTTIPGQLVKARFSGPYKGKPIVWNLQLTTVTDYLNSHTGSEQESIPVSSSQFMFIEECGEENNITVAMAVPIIDEPTLLKAMIMIKKYKRLRPGWHYWGADNGK